MEHISMAHQTALVHRRSMYGGALAALTLISPAPALGAETAPTLQPGSTLDDPIIVIGTRIVPVIQPERDLDEESVSGYNESTIDGLLRAVQSEIGDETEPLILVNGVRVNGLDDIGGLPVEALSNLKVLPRGSAVSSGGTSRQRVVSLTLKKKIRSATALTAHKLATDGDWTGERGEAILTYIEGQKRINVTFKVRDEDSLFESDRDIIQPETLPFAILGNVVGFPNTVGEIDPLLSATVGQVLTVVPVPGSANPSLLDFAASASGLAFDDVGRFRTLRPQTRSYDLEGSFFTQLAPWLTAMASLRLSQSHRLSARGLPSALFVLPSTNPASPFSTDVGLAYYGRDALTTRARLEGGEANLTLNGRLGRWTANFNARHFRTRSLSATDRGLATETVFLTNTVNPFPQGSAGLLPVRRDNSGTRNKVTAARLSMFGPALRMPAGDLQTTVEGQFFDYRVRSSSDFSQLTQTEIFQRSQWSLRGALYAPLLAGSPLGDLDATAEAKVSAYSDAGTLSSYSFGLAWAPFPKLRFRGEFGRSETPAAINLIGDPVVATPGIRVFDPVTGETVDVTQITGGNPGLQPESSRDWQFSGQWTLIKRLNLQLNAEYTDTKKRDLISSVPEASSAVSLAFPDRFIRNFDGMLTTVDLRPVNFDSHREKRIRYGVSLITNLGGLNGTPANPSAGSESDAESEGVKSSRAIQSAKAPIRLQLNAYHSVVLEDKISIRAGLGTVDLLEGGAIGIGSGRVRHQLDGTAALTSNGIGVRLGVNWRGKYTLENRVAGVSDTIHFSPVLAVNLHAFSDLRRLLPTQDWARGMRISVNLLNAANDRQEVRSSAGKTPLQYQAGYRDPIGRTFELELRKVF